jgi:transketolase
MAMRPTATLPEAVIDIDSTTTLADGIRRTVIEQSKRANVGHIGSALSIADILAALYGGVLELPAPHARRDPASHIPPDPAAHIPRDPASHIPRDPASHIPRDPAAHIPRDPAAHIPRDPAAHSRRDRVVLSKGHASLALYAALELTGRLPAGTTGSYCTDGTLLGVHPERDLDGIDFCTGSLGHGLPIAVGAALAARLEASSRRVFVVMSDAELNEGSVWEAVMFAAHHRLANLVVILDLNGQQAMGYTKDVLDLAAPAQRWEAFGWEVHELDGHDTSAIRTTIQDLDFAAGAPHLIIAHTTFGKGVSFMQSVIDWHYLPMTDEQYDQALSELRGVAA